MSDRDELAQLVEYRITSMTVLATGIIASVFLTGVAVAYVLVVLSRSSDATVPLTALVYIPILWIMAGLFMVLAFAIKSDGYCRTVVEKVGSDFNYPALDEWHDSLEDQGLFSEARR